MIDIIVKFKYCKACEFWAKEEGTEGYEEWAENHANECQVNHDGSAGRMEVDAVVEMFQRSESLYNVKYAKFALQITLLMETLRLLKVFWMQIPTIILQ